MKNPSFPDKFYPGQRNPTNYTGMHIPVFCKIFTPALVGISILVPGESLLCTALNSFVHIPLLHVKKLTDCFRGPFVVPFVNYIQEYIIQRIVN